MSRADACGLWWEDVPVVKVKGERTPVVRTLPPVPQTGWGCPQDFPNLSAAGMLCIDVETRDDGINQGLGPGFPRGDAYIVGLGVGTDDGQRWYYPMRHEMGGNMDADMVLRWAKQEFTRPNQPKVGHNVLYDLEALASEGVEVVGPFYDTMLAEPLLDENRMSYSLEACAKTHLGEGKTDEALYSWLSQAYGGNPTRKSQAKNIWRSPVQLCGPYGEGDVDLPLRLLEAQKKKLRQEDLLGLFEMECALIPILLAMRRRGVRVDVAGAERVQQAIQARVLRDKQKLRDLAGCEINVNAGESIARVFDKAGIPYPKTAKGAPSFRREWLEAHPSDVAQMITQIRKWTKFVGTFIEGYILNSHVNGRIHGQFHQLKKDDGGTISGRFSSSAPNLENIPARDEELGPMCRSLFLPEEGEVWYSDDYSQIEYRGIVHYGTGPSAERCRKMYQEDPKTDFHNMVVDMTGIPRKRAKSINFGKSYGMGVKTAAAQMGCSEGEALFFIEQYDREMPFVGELLRTCSRVVEKRGWLKTLLGRRARFDLWEQKAWKGAGDTCLPKDRAEEKWGVGNIRRAGTYKALNRLIQGSAADIFKKALVDIHKAGVFSELGCPLNLVHDELCWSVPQSTQATEAHLHAVHLMKNAVKLSVPLLVDSECGPSWGEVK